MPALHSDCGAHEEFQRVKAMVRPEGIRSGIMDVDLERCLTCGRCVENCPFKCWEIDSGKVSFKGDRICFSCFNCMIACSVGAISIVQTFHQTDGFFDTGFPPYKMPLNPMDLEGNPASWTETERLILERRTVRNFKKQPVSDYLIRRVLEAGRFAPSGGNHQPWKFTVVTNAEFIGQLEEVVRSYWERQYEIYANDNTVIGLVSRMPMGAFDPRVQFGVRCVAEKKLPVFFNAPVVIFLGCNEKMSQPELHAGICGQNMNLAAKSLGLGFCWSSFGRAVRFNSEVSEKLGFGGSWIVQMAFCLGYPKFKQQGVVPRHYRPVTWFRVGCDAPDIEE